MIYATEGSLQACSFLREFMMSPAYTYSQNLHINGPSYCTDWCKCVCLSQYVL